MSGSEDNTEYNLDHKIRDEEESSAEEVDKSEAIFTFKQMEVLPLLYARH